LQDPPKLTQIGIFVFQNEPSGTQAFAAAADAATLKCTKIVFIGVEPTHRRDKLSSENFSLSRRKVRFETKIKIGDEAVLGDTRDQCYDFKKYFRRKLLRKCLRFC
jgi:hypothetical protein